MIWWVRYHDENGCEHRETVCPKKLARDVYKKRKTEVRERRFFPKAEEPWDAREQVDFRPRIIHAEGDRVDDEPLRAIASNRAPAREKSECPRRDSNPRYRRERPTS